MATDIPQSELIQDGSSSGGFPSPQSGGPARRTRHPRRRRAPFSVIQKRTRAAKSAPGGLVIQVRGRNEDTGELVVLVDTGAGCTEWQLMDQRRLERRVAAQIAAGQSEPTYVVRSVPRLRAKNVIPDCAAVARFVQWEGYSDAEGVWVSEDALLEQGVLCAGCAQFVCSCSPQV